MFVDAGANGGARFTNDGADTKAKEEVVTIEEGVLQQAVAEKIETEQSRKKQKIETIEPASSISIIDSEYIVNADRAFKIKTQRAKNKIQVGHDKGESIQEAQYQGQTISRSAYNSRQFTIP